MAPFEIAASAAGLASSSCVPPTLDLCRVEYRLERPSDGDAIERIADDAFGPGRYARAAERVRELYPVRTGLCFVAEYEGEIVGSVRMTELPGHGERALMLGPLAVRPHLKGRGIGKALMRCAEDAARASDFDAIYLVGDTPYYALLGYETGTARRLKLPRPADPSRILVLDL